MNEPSQFLDTPPQPAKPVIKETLVTPAATYTLIVITVIIYLLQTITNAIFGVDLPAAYGMKINEFILNGNMWRLVTPMFLHGSLLHIGFN
ncbi:MAG: rhomboid family intramembrane serine protease, partial [Chloroflexota bacterium]